MWAAIDAAEGELDRGRWPIGRPARRSASSRSTQSRAPTLLGAVPPLPRGRGLGREVRRVEVPHLVGDALAGRAASSPNWRIVSSRPYRVWPASRLRGDRGTCAPASRAGRARRSRSIRGVRADVHRGRHAEAAGEHRAPVEQVPLVVLEQVVRPRHRGEQGLVVLRAPSGAGEQPEAVVEVVAHLLRAHRHHAGGGQLDGEGDAHRGAGRSR